MKCRNGQKNLFVNFNSHDLITSASATSKKKTIHTCTEIYTSKPCSIIKVHPEIISENLSFRAYNVTCISPVIKDHPHLNYFIKGKTI